MHLILVISIRWACRRLAAVVRLRDFHLVHREGDKEGIYSHKAWWDYKQRRWRLIHLVTWDFLTLCLSRGSLQLKRHWSHSNNPGTGSLQGLICIGMAYNIHLIIKILIPRIWNLQWIISKVNHPSVLWTNIYSFSSKRHLRSVVLLVSICAFKSCFYTITT